MSLTIGLLVVTMACRAHGQCQLQKLLPEGGRAGDLIGWSVALHGEALTIGAPQDDDRGSRAGAAYLYARFDGDVWMQVGKITASDGVADDQFGTGVGVDGDFVVAGALFHGFAGAAYVFEQVDDEWVQRAKLTPVGIGVNADFGESVGIHGDVVVGGARFDNPRGLSSGSAFVFERQKDGSWLQVAKLIPNDGGINDFFGLQVDVSGGTIVGAADNDDDRGENAGAVYVFERCGERCWTQTAKLLASDGTDGDSFGSDVAVNGDVIVVGAQGFGDFQGVAYVFERSAATGQWTEVAKLLPADGVPPFARFGFSVDVHDDAAVIGAWQDDDRGEFSGSAYVFRRDPEGRWIQAVKLTAEDGEAGDGLGTSVAVDSGTALIGAVGDDDHGPFTGSAYVFRLSLPPKPGDLDCDGIVDFADLLALLAAWGPTPNCPPGIRADIDGDCDVDFDDLLILLANWG